MKIGLIIADFESSYSTSFQHTARVKYGVDFNTSNVDELGTKLNELKNKIELNQHNGAHVGLEITLEDVIHVEDLLHQILGRYVEVFNVRPANRKIYTINQKLRDADSPSAKDLAKEALQEVFNPEKEDKKLTKKERIKAEAKLLSQQRALDLIRKKSAKEN